MALSRPKHNSQVFTEILTEQRLQQLDRDRFPKKVWNVPAATIIIAKSLVHHIDQVLLATVITSVIADITSVVSTGIHPMRATNGLQRVALPTSGPWWWSIGQCAHLLLRRPVFESRWSIQFFCEMFVEKNEKKQKKLPGLVNF